MTTAEDIKLLIRCCIDGEITVHKSQLVNIDAQVTTLQARVEELEQDKEMLDWLIAMMSQPGEILHQLGWTNGRAAIREAMNKEANERI